MWRNSERIATIVLLFWGLFAVPQQIWTWTSSLSITLIVTLSIVISVSIIAIGYYFPSIKQWISGYQKFKTDSIILRRYGSIHVEKDFRATLFRETDTVFLSKPDPSELVDMMDSLPGFTPAESAYSSDDSRIVDSKVTDSRLVILWEPNEGEIEPLQTYRHRMRHTSPCPYGADNFYHEIYFDRNVGISELEMFFKPKVEEAIAIITSRFHARTTELTLYRYYYLNHRRGCEQPELSEDGHSLKWIIRQPKRNRSYIVFGIYAGEREAFLQRMLEEHAKSRRSRILRMIGRPSIMSLLIGAAAGITGALIYGISRKALILGLVSTVVAFAGITAIEVRRRGAAPK